MPRLDRRTFIRHAASGVALWGSAGFFARSIGAQGIRVLRDDIADLRDGIVRLHVPQEFQYQSFHDTDGPPVVLHDGTILPGRHDGMAAFPAAGGNVWLVRNHELNGPGPAFGPGAPYDVFSRGGTTTVLVTPQGVVLDSFTSLNGTQMNSAGGPTPWGSWITCEETVNGPDVGPDFTGAPNTSLTQPHGYIFEVPAGGQSDRQPIRSAGRFAHDAAAFDPLEGILYLTDDPFDFPSGFYRYVPPTNPIETGSMADGGVLQMMAVVGHPQADLAAAQPEGASYEVTWVDIDEPDRFPHDPGTTNYQAITFVGNQGRAKGAAWFSRLEGAAYDNRVIYLTSSQGGGPAETSFGPITNGYGNGSGQIWAYHIRTQTLELIYQSPGPSALAFPDNITVHNGRGTLIVCEDGPVDNYIRGLSRFGRIFDVALNRLHSNEAPFDPRFGEEFAGATFSPDGRTLFVNIQASAGISFAVWGPWARIGV